MRLRDHALVITLVGGLASSSLLAGCASADPNSLTSDTQTSSEDLRRRCRAKEDGYRGRCAASCMAWGEDDEDDVTSAKGCKADAGAPAPTPTTTSTTPPPPAPTPTTTATTPPPPAPATCASFTYSAWGACQPNGTQMRTVLSSSPAGCTGGSPVTTQTCTYLDGAALYTQYCAGCHGNSKKGKSASSIQAAIDGNVGGMGSLKTLTPAQVAAIAAAP